MKREFRFIIEDIRENELHMTQREFAEKLGVKYTTVESWESGTFPKADKLLAIAKYCNCSVDYLLGLSRVKKVDTDLQSACEYTGLSEKAVSILNHPLYEDIAKTVSILIEDSEQYFFHHHGDNFSIDEDIKFRETHFQILWAIFRYLNIDSPEDQDVIFDSEGNVFDSFDKQMQYYESVHHTPKYQATFDQKSLLNYALKSDISNQIEKLKEYRMSNEDKFFTEGEQDEETEE